MSYSVIQSDKERCFVCGKRAVHNHHIFFGRNRKKADELGLTVYLCWECHEGTAGIHGRDGRALDLALKQMAQRKFEEEHTREEFINTFGKSYL